jgi:AcrR family transcriptional regulator
MFVSKKTSKSTDFIRGTMQALTQAQDQRDSIIHSSLELFYRNGIKGTEISQVIERAGVSEPVFNQNFSSKEDLVLAFLHKRHDLWMEWFTKEVEGRLSQPGAQLEVIADVLQSWFEDPRFRGCAFINTVAEGGKFDSEPFAIAREHKEGLRQFLEDIARKLQHREPELTASAAVLVIEGAIVRAQMTGDAHEAYNARLLFQCLNHS